MMWSVRSRTLRRPAFCAMRRDSSRSATNAISTAVVVTPANISTMPNNRNQVGWSTKLKSP